MKDHGNPRIRVFFFDAGTPLDTNTPPAKTLALRTWVAVGEGDTPLATLAAIRKPAKNVEGTQHLDRANVHTYCSIFPMATEVLVARAVDDLQNRWGLTLYRTGRATPKGGSRLDALGMHIDPYQDQRQAQYLERVHAIEKGKQVDPDAKPLFEGTPAFEPYDVGEAQEMREKCLTEAALILRLHPRGYPRFEES